MPPFCGLWLWRSRLSHREWTNSIAINFLRSNRSSVLRCQRPTNRRRWDKLQTPWLMNCWLCDVSTLNVIAKCPTSMAVMTSDPISCWNFLNIDSTSIFHSTFLSVWQLTYRIVNKWNCAGLLSCLLTNYYLLLSYRNLYWHSKHVSAESCGGFARENQL